MVARLPANVELDDMVQAGMMGLMDAATRFEVSHGTHFEVYAAQRIRGALREGDLVARLGGDEFTIVLDQADDAHAVGTAARKVIDVLSLPFPLQGQDMYVGASIGMVLGGILAQIEWKLNNP